MGVSNQNIFQILALFWPKKAKKSQNLKKEKKDIQCPLLPIIYIMQHIT